MLMVAGRCSLGALTSFSSASFLCLPNISSNVFMFSATTGSSLGPGVAVLVREEARRLIGRPKGPRSTGCLRLRLELDVYVSNEDHRYVCTHVLSI